MIVVLFFANPANGMSSMKLKAPSRAAGTLLFVLAAFVAATIYANQFATARANDQATTELVCKLVSRHHISHAEIDDVISGMLLDRFIEELDPKKLYFTKSDVDELDRFRTSLDDQVREGDCQFAYKTFERYLQRIDERTALAHRLIDAEHDFTIDEEIVTDADAIDWAKTDAEIRERWRKRIKYDLLLLKIDGTPLKEARERLHKRYHNIRSMMRQTEKFEMLEIFLSSLTHCFDPHSSYMSPQTWEDFEISMKLELQGIGAALKSEDGYVTVAQIVPGGAAEKDGRLKVGDKIIGVGQGEDDELVDVVEMKLTRVVRMIRGDKGTKVRLQVKKEAGKIEEYTLTRQVIELKSQEVRGEIIHTHDRIGGRDFRIGVINIPSFYRDFRGAQLGLRDFKSTSRDVLRELQKFREKGGVDAVVVDLRTNGGGALTEAIEVTGLFIDEGPVVQVKQHDGSIRAYTDYDSGMAYSGPLVVVCNRLSASASEIFAGAIKDYRRGIVIGDERTHGKGTVQNLMPVSRDLFRFRKEDDRGKLKLTINQFYRVNGDSTQSRGVESDVVLPSLLDHYDIGESFLDNALPFGRIEAAEYEPTDLVAPEIVAALQKASARRVAADSDFQKTKQQIERFVARKKRKTVSLNEEVLKKEHEQDKRDEEKDEPKTDENGNGPVFPEDHYNDEVLRIAVDYASLLKEARTAGVGGAK